MLCWGTKEYYSCDLTLLPCFIFPPNSSTLSIIDSGMFSLEDLRSNTLFFNDENIFPICMVSKTGLT